VGLHYGWSIGLGSGLILLWKPTVIKEYVWFLLPVAGLLWQLGGTFHKDWRRIALPCVIFICCLLFGTPWLLSLCASILLAIATRLPFTLKGDSVISCWQNWAWIWIWSFLLQLPSLFLHTRLETLIVPLFLTGTFSTLSNISKASKLFPWKMVEFFVGASVAYPFCLVLSS